MTILLLKANWNRQEGRRTDGRTEKWTNLCIGRLCLQKWPPWLPITSTFYLKKLLYYKKLGCLQKNRPINIHLWPNGKRFCANKVFWGCAQIFKKNLITLSIFDFSQAQFQLANSVQVQLRTEISLIISVRPPTHDISILVISQPFWWSKKHG